MTEFNQPGIDMIGGDVCEISPPHDPSGMTALNAAHLLFDMLCHAAEALVRRRKERVTP